MDSSSRRIFLAALAFDLGDRSLPGPSPYEAGWQYRAAALQDSEERCGTSNPLGTPIIASDAPRSHGKTTGNNPCSRDTGRDQSQ